MFARRCFNFRLRSQLVLQTQRTKSWRSIATTAPAWNAETTLHRSTELGAVEETQDIATMDRLLKICSQYILAHFICLLYYFRPRTAAKKLY